MDKIIDRLWLGNLDDGRHAHDRLFPPDAILNISQYAYESPLRVYHETIQDEVFHDAKVWQQLVMRLHVLHGKTNDVVLVHCRLGVSRAPALVAAYLAYCGYSRDVDHALVEVMKKRVISDPHTETWRGVRAWWAQSRGLVPSAV